MASHLTITSGLAGNAATRSFAGAQAGEEATGVLGIFAALLGNTGAPQVSGSGQTSMDLDLGNAFTLGLDAGFGEDAEAADRLALEADLAAQVPADPQPVVGLIDALSQLKIDLDAGKPLDPDLLGSINDALTGLADALGLDLDTLPVPEDFAELLETGAEDTGLAGAVTQLLAPLAGSLAVASKAENAAGIAAETAANAQLKAVGDKLAALLSALEADAVPDDKLAALGMEPGQPAAAEIKDALARFAAGLTETKVPAEPELATPALKLEEPLVGKKSEEAEAKPAGAAADNKPAAPDAPARDRKTEKASPTAAAINIETLPTDSATTAQQPSTPRVDSTTTTRAVIQPGYQTSQQQLNLPQIAFELARQAEGGNTRFQIRLDPPELGRIDVRLDIDNTGQINARLTVEKSETLDLMQRDQRGLERALQQAGVDAGKTNLEFSLKQNPFAGQSGLDGREGGNRGGQQGAGDQASVAEDAPEPAPTVNLYRGTLQARGVNIIA